MKITEIKIKLVDGTEDRLRGFCSITLDNCFAIRDLRIIEGPTGPFVAMPSRKLSFDCSNCRAKNHLQARFCNQCGERLKSPSLGSRQSSKQKHKLHVDIVHPINRETRDWIEQQVIAAYLHEIERSKAPDYRPEYDDSSEDLVQDLSAARRRLDVGEEKTPGPHRDESQRSRIEDYDH